jgi:hypothetical protein
VGQAKIATGRTPVYASRAISEPEHNDGNKGDRSSVVAGSRSPMTNRTTELEAAVRAQDALIAEAQRLLADGQRANGLNRDTVITQLRALLEGPRQHPA